jgi:hypothetical protein
LPDAEEKSQTVWVDFLAATSSGGSVFWGARSGAALAALEAVDGKDTSVEAILARHGEQRLSPEEFDRHFGSLPTDDEG